MARTVSTPANTLLVAYDTFNSDPSEDVWYGDFENVAEDLLFNAMRLFPSLEPYHGWAGREDRILARNGFVEFGVSEYMGLMAIWMRLRGDCEQEALASHWCDQIAEKFHQEFGIFEHVATASNGEAFYQRKEA